VLDYRFRGKEKQFTIGAIAAWEDVHLLSRRRAAPHDR
jgi:hypothetical protein